MDRRNFLQGVFGGVVAGAALVKTDDVSASDLWTPETPLVVIPEMMSTEVGCGRIVFDHLGRPIGVVDEIHVERVERTRTVQRTMIVRASGPVCVLSSDWSLLEGGTTITPNGPRGMLVDRTHVRIK